MLAIGLMLAGWGVLHLARASAKPQAQGTKPTPVPGAVSTCGFGLKLSAVAERVELKGRDGRILFQSEQSSGPFTGMITLDQTDPAVFVSVKWKEPAASGDHFAKLTLEPAGKPTLTHFFEAPGAIEDVWELPAE